jgi:hypothetical protein
MPCWVTPKTPPAAVIGIYRFLQQDDDVTSRMYKGFLESTYNSIYQSAFLTRKARFAEARQQLSDTLWLDERSWHPYEAEKPNTIARNRAVKILDALEAASLPPTHVMPSAEGGITMSFVEGQSRAEIEAYNTGEIAVATYSGQTAPMVWELTDIDSELEQAVAQIRVRLTS